MVAPSWSMNAAPDEGRRDGGGICCPGYLAPAIGLHRLLMHPPARPPAASPLLQLKRIQPFTMPLMSLAATALDQPKHRDDVISTMLQVGLGRGGGVGTVQSSCWCAGALEREGLAS